MSFLLDKEFSEKYEEHFAKVSGYIWNKSDTDDHGVDIFSPDSSIIIDVKCYASPKIVNHFRGVFLEMYLPRSGRDGWLIDDTKLTTHYILLQDCDRDKVNYFRGWYIARDDLVNAMLAARDDGKLLVKITDTAEGVILPYMYLDMYCAEKWKGNK